MSTNGRRFDGSPNPENNRVSWRLGLILGLALAACGGNRRDPVARAARAADAEWRQRAMPGGLDNALQAYLNLDQQFPSDPQVLWRLARMYTTMADADPDTAIRNYATAREFGLRCLMLEPSFAGLVISRGGMVVPEAAKELTEDSKECLVWTVIAWSRWVHERGSAGVGLDHEVLAALGNRAGELAGDWGLGRGYYAKGLALSLPPKALNPDLTGAKQAFEEALAESPERLTPKVDLALYVYQPRGKLDEVRQMLQEVVDVDVPTNDPEAMEDLHAQRRARAALGLPPVEEPGPKSVPEPEASP
jgi:hypothetical protein